VQAWMNFVNLRRWMARVLNFGQQIYVKDRDVQMNPVGGIGIFDGSSHSGSQTGMGMGVPSMYEMSLKISLNIRPNGQRSEHFR
jgi:hypothetical protein